MDKKIGVIMSNKSQRMVSQDIAKGIAILLVVLVAGLGYIRFKSTDKK